MKFHSGSLGTRKRQNITGNTADDSTKTELKTGLEYTGGMECGGVRRRNAGEGNEWKNTRNRARLTKEMQSKCGGKADWWGAEENRTETKQCKRHHKGFEKAQNRNKMKLKWQEHYRDTSKLHADFMVSRVTTHGLSKAPCFYFPSCHLSMWLKARYGRQLIQDV